MVIPSRDGRDCGDTRHLCRGRVRDRRPVTQQGCPPDPDVAVIGQGDGVAHSAGHHGYSRQTRGGNRYGAAVRQRADSQLTAAVGAPPGDDAATLHRVGMGLAVVEASGAHGLGVDYSRHLDGDNGSGGYAVAELSVVVGSPCQDGAIVFQRQGVTDSGRHHGHCHEAVYLDGRGAVDSVSVPQLAGIIIPPSPWCGVGCHRHGEIIPGADRGDRPQTGCPDREETVGDGAVTKLTEAVTPPAPD